MTALELAKISVHWACESVAAQRELLTLMEELNDTDSDLYRDAQRQLAYWQCELVQRQRTLDELT